MIISTRLLCITAVAAIIATSSTGISMVCGQTTTRGATAVVAQGIVTHANARHRQATVSIAAQQSVPASMSPGDAAQHAHASTRSQSPTRSREFEQVQRSSRWNGLKGFQGLKSLAPTDALTESIQSIQQGYLEVANPDTRILDIISDEDPSFEGTAMEIMEKALVIYEESLRSPETPLACPGLGWLADGLSHWMKKGALCSLVECIKWTVFAYCSCVDQCEAGVSCLIAYCGDFGEECNCDMAWDQCQPALPPCPASAGYGYGYAAGQG